MSVRRVLRIANVCICSSPSGGGTHARNPDLEWTDGYSLPVSTTDYVNGANPFGYLAGSDAWTAGVAGPPNANGVALTLSTKGSFGGDGGLSDGLYNMPSLPYDTSNGWGLYELGSQTAVYSFATPVNIRDISIYVGYGGYSKLDVLVEVDTGSGYTTLVHPAYRQGTSGDDMLRVTDSVSPGVADIATGVQELRFTFTTESGVFTMLREIDVNASPAPEPSTTIMGLGAAACLLCYALRKRRVKYWTSEDGWWTWARSPPPSAVPFLVRGGEYARKFTTQNPPSTIAKRVYAR